MPIIRSVLPPEEFRRPDNPHRRRRRERIRREIERGAYQVDLVRLADRLRARKVLEAG